jgi:hypothetical protein
LMKAVLSNWFGLETSVLRLCASFGFSANGFRGYLNKMKIATVKNEELKKALNLSGKVRLLNQEGISSLLEDRVKDETIFAAAKLMLLAVRLWSSDWSMYFVRNGGRRKSSCSSMYLDVDTNRVCGCHSGAS